MTVGEVVGGAIGEVLGYKVLSDGLVVGYEVGELVGSRVGLITLQMPHSIAQCSLVSKMLFLMSAREDGLSVALGFGSVGRPQNIPSFSDMRALHIFESSLFA